MSNRRRIARKPQSYTARLQRRSPAGRPPRQSWTARQRGTATWLPAVLAVIGEAGHLIGAYTEWPGSTARGVYHVVAGALLGLVAAVVVTGAGRVAVAAGGAVAISGPATWVGGTLLDASPYQQLPAPVAAGVAVCEVALAAVLLLTAGRAGRLPSRATGDSRARAARSRAAAAGRVA